MMAYQLLLTIIYLNYFKTTSNARCLQGKTPSLQPDPSTSSPYIQERFQSEPYDGNSSRTYQEQVFDLKREQIELKEMIKSLVGRVEKLEERLDEKTENTSSKKLPPELSVCYYQAIMPQLLYLVFFVLHLLVHH